MRGCSTTTGSRSSGSGFEYNHIRRPSTPCATSKGRLSVDFAAFPPGGLEKVEMLALQAKRQTILLIRYIAVSQDEHGAFCSENGTNDDNNSNNNNEYQDDNGNKRKQQQQQLQK